MFIHVRLELTHESENLATDLATEFLVRVFRSFHGAFSGTFGDYSLGPGRTRDPVAVFVVRDWFFVRLAVSPQDEGLFLVLSVTREG